MIFIENQQLRIKNERNSMDQKLYSSTNPQEEKKERGEKEKEEKRMNLVFIITTHTPTNSCVNGKVPPAD